jgi:phytoene dehydrogenase-like protein
LTLLRTDFLSFTDKLELMRWFSNLSQLKAKEWKSVSIQEWLNLTIRSPRLKQLMEANARTTSYTTAIDLVSADVFIERLQITTKKPIIYLDGGWQTLVNEMRRTAEQAGVKIVSGTRVEAIEYPGGQVQGVRLQGDESIPITGVIIATPSQDAVKLVPALKQLVDALIPAPIACLDVALSQLPDPRYPIVQDLDHPRFMTTQSLFSQVAPDGGAIIYTFKQLDPLHPSNPQDDERDLESLLDTVQPGWRDVLVKRYYLPRIEAVGALPTAKNGGLSSRPAVQVAGITGLYLAGDWVGEEGFLVDASMASARQAAQLILKHVPAVSL